MSREMEDRTVRQAQDILERRMGVRDDIKVNLQHVVQYAAYYQGLRKGLEAALGIVENPPKGEDRIYMEAEFRLYCSTLRNAQLWDDGTEIRYRNWKRDKRGRLASCEAYFVERRNVITEVK